MTRKEQIIQKAIDLFAAESFESISIQRLAEETGVAQGLLYRHFKNKNDLLLQLLLMGLMQVKETLQPYGDDTLNFKEAFAEHLHRAIKYLETDTKLWKVLHATRQNGALMAGLGITADPVKEIIKPIKNKLAKEKIPDADTVAWYIFTLIDGLASVYLVHPEQYPLRKMERLLNENIKAYVSK